MSYIISSIVEASVCKIALLSIRIDDWTVEWTSKVENSFFMQVWYLTQPPGRTQGSLHYTQWGILASGNNPLMNEYRMKQDLLWRYSVRKATQLSTRKMTLQKPYPTSSVRLHLAKGTEKYSVADSATHVEFRQGMISPNFPAKLNEATGIWSNNC